MFFSIYDFNEFNSRVGTFNKGDTRLKNALKKRFKRSATNSELAEARRQLNLDIRLRNKNRVVEAYNQKIATIDRQNRSNNKGVILGALGIGEYDEINGISEQKMRRVLKDIKNLGDPRTTKKIIKNINKTQKNNRKAGLESFDPLSENFSIETVANMNLSLNGPSIEND